MMENTNMILADNIQKLRKKCGLTQEELAGKLGVTFQAVSKWENAKSAPDILLLPQMAEIFGCSIDEIFSRGASLDMPWGDDGVIRIFQTIGRNIVKTQDEKSYIEVAFPRNCNETTRQYFKVEVYGNIVCDSSINGDVVCHGRLECHDVNGGVNADGSIAVGGSISGGCNAGAEVTVGSGLSGGVNAMGDITVGGHLDGGCNCTGNINCNGDLHGDVSAETVTVQGDVEAVKIKGNVTCNSVKCEKIEK